MDKRFWGILAAIAVLLGGIYFLTGSSNDSGAQGGEAGTLTNHVKGEGASGVTLTEYGDFECPACAQYYPIVKQVYEKYKGDIKLQFRNFPLFQIHQNAIAAARAAEAADMQGKFWEMHDKLYENQQAWTTSRSPQNEFEGYAKELGLNVEKFKTDLKSRTTNDRVQADIREGNRLKVESTPTFFIDGKKISNPGGLEDFNKVIEAAIEQKTGKKPSAATEPAATEQAQEAPAPTPAPAEGQ